MYPRATALAASARPLPCARRDRPPTDRSSLSLHHALPISRPRAHPTPPNSCIAGILPTDSSADGLFETLRSEEHTSELQSRQYLVCRLLLEKKKQEVGQGARRRPTHPRERAGPDDLGRDAE